MAKKPIEVEALKHDAASRKNIPTAEFESVMREEDKSPVRLAYERRNRDLDPQLVWRGKDEQDWSELVVQAPPLYIQEKVHPKVIIDDLKQESRRRAEEVSPAAPDLFADFNGLKDLEAKTEFYQHDQHWSNRMICGDSLSVMASLAEREGLRGKVQCIYFDPPYGIKFNSNFQWSTTSRDVKDGDKSQVTREPEQVRAFRDTWRDGVHSYLTYLRDRLTVARDLLHESGSIFVQIGDENVHRVRALMDEVFGEDNFVVEIALSKATGLTSQLLASTFDFILWYSRHKPATKFRQLYRPKPIDEELRGEYRWLDESGVHVRRITDMELSGTHDLDLARVFKTNSAVSPGVRANTTGKFSHQGQTFDSGPQKNWKTTMAGMIRLRKANRLLPQPASIRIYKQFWCDFDRLPINNTWFDIRSEQNRIYVVQTVEKAIARCILMSTDPGDLVLDPTCGSGTTAYVCEHWGRRWITIDTSRVAVALARSRLMGARYPYYLLADSSEGQRKEGEVSRTPPKSAPTRGDIRHGFVYDRVPHIMLSDIAKNAEIDVIWEKWQETLEPLRTSLDKALSQKWEEWEIPREDGEPWDAGATHAFYIAMNTDRSLDERNAALRVIVHNTRKNFTLETLPKKPRCPWPDEPTRLHREWWEARIARQKEIDASIASRAKAEYLYDKPYIDKDRIRVAGPFTVESLSPHRTLAVDWDDELIDTLEASEGKRAASTRDEAGADFAQMILENLRAAGVQQAHKEDRIVFTSLVGWPGDPRNLVCAEGRFMEGAKEKRAGIFIGPEFGTVSRPDLVHAAREAGDAGFDLLIACAFNYDAHSAEFDKLGRVPILKARMNPDLHMGGELKTTSAGNLFVIFGEPDIKIEDAGDGMIRVKVFGVDVFKPQSGEVVSEGTDGIALWMLDTDYNEESFFVRHAYFLGANDPYKALKTTLKAEIDEEAWASLYSDVSRPFAKPKSGRIAVKVINHLGDEVMKVFGVI